MHAKAQVQCYHMKRGFAEGKVYEKDDFLKIYHDEEFSVFRASPFEFSAVFRAVAALPRNFLWLDMTRRAGMHRFIELSSKSNIGGWVIGGSD